MVRCDFALVVEDATEWSNNGQESRDCFSKCNTTEPEIFEINGSETQDFAKTRGRLSRGWKEISSSLFMMFHQLSYHRGVKC